MRSSRRSIEYCSTQHLMFAQLQSRLPPFRSRRSETVAWCVGQPLESTPVEGAEILPRRRRGDQAGKWRSRAFFSGAPWFWKSHLYRQPGRLFAKAGRDEIAALSHPLRSPVLQPGCSGFASNRFEQAQIVDDLSERRAAQLLFPHQSPPSLWERLESGRPWLYAPDENLVDGAARSASPGFFDADNIPPWDAWVRFFEPYLVRGVPPQLVELANQGIDANPEPCMLWTPEPN